MDSLTKSPTRVQRLRALPDDLARGDMCLGWAEQCRDGYEAGQREYQFRAVTRATFAAGRGLMDDEKRHAVAQGAAEWGRTVVCNDFKSNEQMFGRWADNYYHRHAAVMADRAARLAS